MNFENIVVEHKIFGTGTVTEGDGTYIIVNFEGKNRRFRYPEAFNSLLKAKDPAVQEEIRKQMEINRGNAGMELEAEMEQAQEEITFESFARKEIDRLEKLCRKMPTLTQASRCLNLCVLENKIPKTFCREEEISQIMRVLLRRFKANVLLTGSAGVGKTAVAEGLADYVVQKRWEKYSQGNCYVRSSFCERLVIFELSLNALVSGTKYRGEFEVRIQKILEELRFQSDVVIYIDEIHQAYQIGRSEGSPSVIDILKPAMARNEVRIVGSTTSEEAKVIHDDKALERRFTEVCIYPLSGTKAVTCLEQILPDYSAYFRIKMGKDINALGLLKQVEYFFPEMVFPNNVIDVIDQTLATAKFDGRKEITMADINHTLSVLTGYVIM